MSEIDTYGPESQFEQTVGYLERLVTEYGRVPVDGELYKTGIARSLLVDPTKNGYAQYDLYISQTTDDGFKVNYPAYTTYVFDPDSRQVTRSFFIPGDFEPTVTQVDDQGQRDLIVAISDAMHNGKVVPQPAYFKRRPLLRFLGVRSETV